MDNYLSNITVKHTIKWILLAWNNIQMPTFINCFRHVGINGLNLEEISSQEEEKTLIESANILAIEEPEFINEDIQTYENIDKENWEDELTKTSKMKILMSQNVQSNQP